MPEKLLKLFPKEPIHKICRIFEYLSGLTMMFESDFCDKNESYNEAIDFVIEILKKAKKEKDRESINGRIPYE
jgi:hypothetical protein